MQNDTENEIGRSLFPFIHGLRIVIGFDKLRMMINHSTLDCHVTFLTCFLGGAEWLFEILTL